MSTPTAQITNAKHDAIKAAIAAQVAALVEAHYVEIINAATESFKQDQDAGEIEAKIAFAVSFLPAIAEPSVKVRASWSVRYSAESETLVDVDQGKLELAPPETAETSAEWLGKAKRRAKEVSA